MADESYTYWSAGEMRALKEYKAMGYSINDIAETLRRSPGAIKSRLYYLDIARLSTIKDANATLVSMRKRNGRKH